MLNEFVKSTRSVTVFSAHSQSIRKIWSGSKNKLYGRQIPENKTNDKLWIGMSNFPKSDVYLPTLYSHLDLRRQRRPEPSTEADSKPLTPNLPTNKVLHKIASTVHDTSMATADFFMKFMPASKSASDKNIDDPKIYFSPLESFLLDMYHLESWNELSDSLETKLTHIEQLKQGQTIAILGGGISGLSLAWFIAHSRPDVKIKLIEQTNRYGGWMTSEKILHDKSSTTFEFGPRTLLPTHPGVMIAVQMMQQLDMLKSLRGIPKSDPVNAKGLFYNNQLIKLPSSLKEMIGGSNKLFGGLISGLVRDFFIKSNNKKKDESVESFISRRLNKSLSDNLVSAVLRGIYGGDISQLSVRSVSRFSNFHSLEKMHGASLLSAILTGEASTPDSQERKLLPEFAKVMLENDWSMPDNFNQNSMLMIHGGMQTFAEKLGAALEFEFPNVDIFRQRAITGVESLPNQVAVTTEQGKIVASIAVSTLPANKLSNILDEKAEKARALCKEIPFTNMAVVDFWFPDRIIGKNWFGYLVPKSEDPINKEGVLGVVFDSATRNAALPLEDVEIKRQKGSVLTVMMGGPLWDPEITEKTAISRAVEALQKQLQVKISPGEFIAKAHLNRECIPQYTVGHAGRVQQIHQDVSKVYNNRLFLAGTSFGRGVGIGDCIVDSLTIASRFSEQRKLLFADYYSTMWIRKVYPDEVV